MIPFFSHLNRRLFLFIFSLIGIIVPSNVLAATISIENQVTDSEGHSTRIITTGGTWILDFGRQDALGRMPVTNGQFVRLGNQGVALFVADLIFNITADNPGEMNALLSPSTEDSFSDVSFVVGGDAINHHFEANQGVSIVRGNPQLFISFQGGTSTIPLSLAYASRDSDFSLNRRDTITFIVGEQ